MVTSKKLHHDLVQIAARSIRTVPGTTGFVSDGEHLKQGWK